MNVLAVADATIMSALAADVIAATIVQKPNAVLGLATGATPMGVYAKLIEKQKENGLSFAGVRSYNLDEYVGLHGNDPQSYRRYMMENLFQHVDIKNENIHVPNGDATDIARECRQYDEQIVADGGIDLQLLGIGNNGHIGFNEPSDHFTLPTHYVEIDASTREANARFFSSIDVVPKAALTVGMGAIMAARAVLLIASVGKADIVERALNGPVTPAVPASILQFHPNTTVIYVK